MVERRGYADLAGEPVGTEHGAELGSKDLDRHLAPMAAVVGQVDRGHAPVAELTEDGVVVCERVNHPR
jgi:hypothetical protein